jgi:hypothetical protein
MLARSIPRYTTGENEKDGKTPMKAKEITSIDELEALT